jgi:hypothetical protein
LHALIALKPLSHVQANIFLCAPVQILHDKWTRTFQGSLESSKSSRSIDPGPPPELDEGGCPRRGRRMLPPGAPGAGACCSFACEGRDGLWLRPRWRRRGRQSLNLLSLMNGVLWDAEVRLQLADLGCIWIRRPNRIGNPFQKSDENVALNSERPHRFGLV